jgi:hypothetical protein
MMEQVWADLGGVSQGGQRLMCAVGDGNDGMGGNLLYSDPKSMCGLRGSTPDCEAEVGSLYTGKSRQQQGARQME